MKKKQKTYRRQRRIPGGRTHRGAGLESRVDRLLEQTCTRFACSPGLVITTALAHFFGLELDKEDKL